MGPRVEPGHTDVRRDPGAGQVGRECAGRTLTTAPLAAEYAASCGMARSAAAEATATKRPCRGLDHRRHAHVGQVPDAEQVHPQHQLERVVGYRSRPHRP